MMAWGKDLSGRELQIANLISQGLTNQQIGDALHISEPTVKTHLRNIYSKTDIHDRANLAISFLNFKNG
jgi:DNA-binding NarL/FixJ family response regulator